MARGASLSRVTYVWGGTDGWDMRRGVHIGVGNSLYWIVMTHHAAETFAGTTAKQKYAKKTESVRVGLQDTLQSRYVKQPTAGGLCEWEGPYTWNSQLQRGSRLQKLQTPKQE